MQVVLKYHNKNLVWCSVISRIQRQHFSFYLSKRLKKLFSGVFSKIGFLATFFLFLPLMEFFHFCHNSDQKIFNRKIHLWNVFPQVRFAEFGVETYFKIIHLKRQKWFKNHFCYLATCLKLSLELPERILHNR